MRVAASWCNIKQNYVRCENDESFFTTRRMIIIIFFPVCFVCAFECRHLSRKNLTAELADETGNAFSSLSVGQTN